MDIVLRAAVVFALLWLALRASGKREVTQLSTFELVVLVTLGDLVGQTVVQEDFSLTTGALAVSTFVLLSTLLSYVSWRFPQTRGVLEGRPTVILRDGVPDLDAMATERLPLDDLEKAARERGIRDLASVDLAVLESDGKFSFFVREGTAGSQ
ncbi:MAG: YetF domain-containing protein [Candidatus Nanopelagicales bacterium]